MQIKQWQRYGVLGAGLGLAFPVLAILLDILVFKKLDLSWASVLEVHRVNPLHFIIDTAPLVLGLAFTLFGLSLNSQEERHLVQGPLKHLSYAHHIALGVVALLGIVGQVLLTQSAQKQTQYYADSQWIIYQMAADTLPQTVLRERLQNLSLSESLIQQILAAPDRTALWPQALKALNTQRDLSSQRSEIIQKTLFILTLVILLFELLLIFGPTLQQANIYLQNRDRSIEKEKTLNQELSQSLENLQHTNQRLQAAQQASQARQTLLQHVERLANVGGYEYDIIQETYNHSDHFYTLLGIPLEETDLRKTLRRVIFAQDLDAMNTWIQEQILAKETSYTFMFRAWVEGQIRTFQDIGVFVYDKQGRASSIVGVIKDITEKEDQRLQRIREQQIMDGLYAYITNPNAVFAHQTQEVLYFATKVLGMEMGVVSRSKPEANVVEILAATPNEDFEAGDTFPYRDTCAALVDAREDILFITDLKDHAQRPSVCYDLLRARAYIGVPVQAGSGTPGTLSFYASSPRTTPPTGFMRNFLFILGQWISGLLQRTDNERRLTKARELAEARAEKIQDSIRYAMRIQSSLIPTEAELQAIFGEAFVMYRPRDGVSGDFYWVKQMREKVFFAVADCTGHGVPGAMVSMMGIVLINELVSMLQIQSPDLILYELHRGIQRLLNQEDDNKSQDGMDIAICLWDKKAQTLAYAGAKTPLVYIQNSQVHTIRGTRRSVGGRERTRGEERLFALHTLPVTQAMSVYLFSDGYPDQFGGSYDQPKKFSQRRLRELFLEVAHLPFAEQKKWVEEQFEEWKTDREVQIDDVLVCGMRLHP